MARGQATWGWLARRPFGRPLRVASSVPADPQASSSPLSAATGVALVASPGPRGARATVAIVAQVSPRSHARVRGSRSCDAFPPSVRGCGDGFFQIDAAVRQKLIGRVKPDQRGFRYPVICPRRPPQRGQRDPE